MFSPLFLFYANFAKTPPAHSKQKKTDTTVPPRAWRWRWKLQSFLFTIPRNVNIGPPSEGWRKCAPMHREGIHTGKRSNRKAERVVLSRLLLLEAAVSTDANLLRSGRVVAYVQKLFLNWQTQEELVVEVVGVGQRSRWTRINLVPLQHGDGEGRETIAPKTVQPQNKL